MNYISTKSDNPIKSYDIKCGTKSAKKIKKISDPAHFTWGFLGTGNGVKSS
jgi:hypothetical protein